MFQFGKSGCQTRLGPCQGLCRGRNWLILFLENAFISWYFKCWVCSKKHDLEVVAYKLLVHIWLTSCYFQFKTWWLRSTCCLYWMLFQQGNRSQFCFILNWLKEWCWPVLWMMDGKMDWEILNVGSLHFPKLSSCPIVSPSPLPYPVLRQPPF